MYMVLREQILEGAFDAQSPMPSENELARSFKVSRITVRRALEKLEREGMIRRRRGLGTFPIQRAARPAELRTSITGLLENLLAMGLSTEVQLIDFRYVGASEDVAAKLALPMGSTVQKAVRVRKIKGQPMSHLTTWIPEDIGRKYAPDDLAAEPLLVLLENVGIKVSSADQTITARLADATVAGLLDVPVGSPLLAVKRVVFDQDDRPVEYIQALYRPDVYEYRLTMSRKTSDESSIWQPTG
ncbi:MAG: GntR family transcriptional regulator [Azospirillaceae bacterium]